MPQESLLQGRSKTYANLSPWSAPLPMARVRAAILWALGPAALFLERRHA